MCVGGLVCAPTTWTQQFGDSCATGESGSNAGIFKKKKKPCQGKKFQKKEKSWGPWSARMLDVPCEWSTSWPHFNHKHMSWQLIIPKVSAGEPTVQNVLYHISLQTSVHPSACFCCSTAGKQSHLSLLWVCELLLPRWSHATEFITLSIYDAHLRLCLNRFKPCIQNNVIFPIGLTRHANTTAAEPRELGVEDSPNSSSPNPRMWPINMEPQVLEEPRQRGLSCHCSPLAGIDRVDFWRVRRLLGEPGQARQVNY